MRTDTGQVFKLSDYREPDYLIPELALIFRLDPNQTIVTAELTVTRRKGCPPTAPLVLDGDGLTLANLSVDGAAVDRSAVEISPNRLALLRPPAAERFTVFIETQLAPSANEALMGLYRSNGVYCTQCEAEGFRRITYFPDRPDVLSVYSVRIEARASEAPVLLSNGNPGKAGALGDGWHFAEWHDPFPKPSYLFALVAGDLARVSDRFTTASGREVDLGIYVEHGKQERAAYAMDALKRSMRWDEEVFGREYDLDVFNIVAVSDFNMGAMENKGLNIFNDKYVLADEATATDTDFAHIEAIIAHEYFHNWTGNRITCRDWFQLCLKEGLTVYRDHEFSADQRSRAVKRIAEVRLLKSHQFPEDAGPLAHPVRPRQYREINNFYTATVYEKGSEVVRMIHTILGPDGFRAGMDLYFERHDGEAATVEQFLACFEDASGRDLSQFALWYNQAGTPNLAVRSKYEPREKTFTVEIEQSTPPTPGESRKRLVHIPVAFGLVGENGHDIEPETVEGAEADGGIIHVRKRRHVVRFAGVAQRPVLSLLRGFSAPVTLDHEQSVKDRVFLARHDDDLYSRWQALDRLLTDTLIDMSRHRKGGRKKVADSEFIRLLGDIACDDMLEPAYRALALTLPGEADIAREIGSDVDPDAIHSAREDLLATVAAANHGRFADTYAALAMRGPFSPDAESAGRRALRNVLLDFLSIESKTSEPAARHFAGASNMTDLAAGLQTLAHRFPGSHETENALKQFEQRFGDDPLVLDKWFSIQATVPGTATLERIAALMNHPGFSITNPNRVRALIGTFATANQTAFHRADGDGYRFFAGLVLKIGTHNPQVAARLATALRSWRALEPVRRDHARAALVSIAEAEDLSTDVRDIVERTLA
ncbi:MAG: aminopeptidase N [Notoacmeibacter sp.]|nr:aminopeptidase N [Notoacmeibacter sp.]